MFAVVFIVVFVSVFSLNCLRQKKTEKQLQEITECLNNFNRTIYDAKEMSWKLGKVAAWVQLDLNYVYAQMNKGV